MCFNVKCLRVYTISRHSPGVTVRVILSLCFSNAFNLKQVKIGTSTVPPRYYKPSTCDSELLIPSWLFLFYLFRNSSWTGLKHSRLRNHYHYVSKFFACVNQGVNPGRNPDPEGIRDELDLAEIRTKKTCSATDDLVKES